MRAFIVEPTPSVSAAEACHALPPTHSCLSPDGDKQCDFFVADILDASLKNDVASMEHPLFALRAGDRRIREYERKGTRVTVKPGPDGCATIHDKDLWIYCISQLVEAKNRGRDIARTVRFTAYDFLHTTNRGTSGRAYIRLGEMLARLTGTRVETNIETSGKGLAAAQGITGWKGLGAGLGHAMQAAGSEAAQGMRAKVGLDKRSEHAVDRHGKDVDNLGTRAANRIDARAQAARESNAGDVVAEPANAVNAVEPNSGASGSYGDGSNTGMPEHGRADLAAAPPAGNDSAPKPPSSIADIKPMPLSTPRHVDAGGGQIQDAVRRVKPPQLPHDGSRIEAPNIRLESDE
jgi:hypothetical protein